MKPLLHLRVNKQLTLTPQLQQAIRLLQLSTLDLQQEIQHQIESNPMLEAISIEDPNDSSHKNDDPLDEEFSDFQWSHAYASSPKPNHFNEDAYIFENLHHTTFNLQDHLRWQLELMPINDIDKVIATAIIDAINEDGFLTTSLSDIYQSLCSNDYALDLQEVVAVKHRIQQFDPVGCGAESLAEFLINQLEQLPHQTASISLAKRIITENINLLAKHQHRKLMTIYSMNEDTLDEVLHTIQQLNPYPVNTMTQTSSQYITPDLLVRNVNNHWQVELNQSTLPHLSINKYYASLIERASNSSDNQFLKNNLQEARWLIKNIQNRQETLLNVARYIIDFQKAFLEYGEGAMRALILSEVADALKMHESTISRVTTQKYIDTPRGLFELKYFFSSHICTTLGGECSSTAIRAVIKKLIATEPPSNPFSDNQIAKMINTQGIEIARRTVAKYREILNIPPSSERKSMNRGMGFSKTNLSKLK